MRVVEAARAGSIEVIAWQRTSNPALRIMG
jgi:hypothetical protein